MRIGRWILAATLVGVPMPATARNASVRAPKGAFRHPALTVSDEAAPIADLPGPLAAALAADLAALGATPEAALYDARAGRLTSLVLSTPLLPGRGVGNSLAWEAGATPLGKELEARAWAALRGYLERHCGHLRIDLSELGEPSVVVIDEGDRIHVFVPRVVDGVPVRGNAVTAMINHGNLVLLTLANWGDIPALSAEKSAETARAALRQQGASFLAEGKEDPRLEIVPADGVDRIEYRLAWVFGGVGAGWESLVDAVSGEILALEEMPSLRPRDAAPTPEAVPEPRSFSLMGPAGAASFRTVMGGVYPVSNDQVGADGTEQPGYPMPFTDVTVGSLDLFCDAGGNAGCHDGTITTTLAGQFVHIVDNCGAITESSSGNIDLGFGPNPGDTNCTVPAGHSAGDTKASRTAYFVLNRVNAQARGYFPVASWLNLPVTVNVNLTPSCNAFWNGLTLNYSRAGSGCANTGEIASLLAYAWANGFDDSVGIATISRPAGGIAGLLPALFFDQSCVGRGFTPGQNCNGSGDPCEACTGILDADFDDHVSGLPHDLTWIAASCPVSGTLGPCGRIDQCESQIVAEVAWDLAHRDLTAPPFSLSPSTALERATRLFVVTGAAVGDWYQCTPPFGGCSGGSGYLRALAFDDDDGSLANGTPYMSAIFNAFNRHQIACAAPAVTDFGCAGGPTAAPALTVTPKDKGASLSWTAVAGATRYDVYTAAGVNACATGRIRIGQTTETSFEVSGLQNGQTYSYTVQGVGVAGSCRGAMSACEIVVPAAGPNLVVLGIDGTIHGGDGDDFLDNCERVRVTIQVQSTGSDVLHNVRIVGVTSSNPSVQFPEPFPRPVATTLSACETAEGTFRIFLQGLTSNEDLDLVVSLTADEIAPSVWTQDISASSTEMEWDLAPVASRTWSFETPGNLEGWSIVQGTWTQQTAGGGGGGTSTYVRSSQALNNACDQIRSPLLRLTPSSTLTLSTNFTIEPFSGAWHDRANVAVFDVEDGSATTIAPSGGRPYSIGPGSPGGACVTANEPGWAGTQNTWATSTFSSADLTQGGAFTERHVRLELAYATDGAAALDGFRFDEVTLTNFEDLVPDAQPDACTAQSADPIALAVDAAGNGVLQPGETVQVQPTWENGRPAAVSLTGGLSAFTGPMPATYAIPDITADYGTLAFDESAACVDCYQVQVTAPARPVVHWDATALETVAPTGQTKSWTLHVGDSFTDVPPSSIFYRFVETLLHNSVTAGCGPGSYCPANSTTREQMAVFVLVAKDGLGSPPPACGTPVFGDVPASSPYCRFIEELARRGVVAGCGGGNYCPTSPVSREQMAVFALATEEGPGYAPPACVPPNTFNDVPETSGFCRWIEELSRRGVVAGCGGGNYCPTLPVTREQMGVFLTQTFGLKLYSP